VLNGGAGLFILRGSSDGAASVAAAIALLFLTLPLTVALVKNRMFQKAHVAYASKILSELAASTGEGALEEVPTTTQQAHKVLAIEAAEQQATSGLPAGNRSWVGNLGAALLDPWEMLFRRVGAYNLLFGTVLATHFGQLVLIGLALDGRV
jgi:hypothetical protein